MNNWTEIFLEILENYQKVIFYPASAKMRGYKVYSFLEIDPEYMLDVLYKKFKINIEYVSILEVYVKPNLKKSFFSKKNEYNIAKMHKKHFINNINSGSYLEAMYIGDGISIFILGSDESWLVFDPDVFSETQYELRDLIKISYVNIELLKKLDYFRDFLIP